MSSEPENPPAAAGEGEDDAPATVDVEEHVVESAVENQVEVVVPPDEREKPPGEVEPPEMSPENAPEVKKRESKGFESKKRESRAEMALKESSLQSLGKRPSKDSDKDYFSRRKSQRSIRGAVGSIISFRRGSIAEYYDRQRAAKFMNTYKLDSERPFNVDRVTKILEEVLVEALDNLTYDAEKVPKQAKWASSAIRAKVKEQEYDRSAPNEEGRRRARRKSATDEEFERLKLKQSLSVCDEERFFAPQDVAVPPPSPDEFSFNLLSYLGKVAVSEQSFEVSHLWESEENIPSGLASTMTHKSFPFNEDKLSSLVPTDEGIPPTCCFAEESSGDEDECFCRTSLRRWYHEEMGTEGSSSTTSSEDDEGETIPESVSLEKRWDSTARGGKPRRFCDHFESVHVIADKFVGWIISSAEAAVTSEVKQQEAEGGKEEEAVSSMVTFMESTGFSWPAIRDFTPQVGKSTVREYVSTWYHVENWVYDVNLVSEQSDECSDFFTYETRWGIPTKQYPIPQITASIFFVVEVSRVKPIDCLVDITYYYEGCSYVQTPYVNFFNESHLFNIVEAKLKFYKQLRF